MTPATDAQRGIWLTERLGGAGSAFHLPLSVRFDGPLDVDALARACDAVVERHPALRTCFVEHEGAVVQLPSTRRPTLTASSGDLAADIAEPFDLEQGPPARFRLLTHLGSDSSTLLFVAHHVVFDGMSKDVLLADLSSFYRSANAVGAVVDANGRPSADVTVERAAARLWSTRRGALDEVALPGGSFALPLRPAPARSLAFAPYLAFADAIGVSRFEVLLAALHALLLGYGNPDAAIAVDMSTRAPGDDQAIGCHVNEIPVPADRAERFRDLALGLRATLRELRPVRSVPYARAVGGLRPRAALAPVSLSYRRRGPNPVFEGMRCEVEWAMSNAMVRGIMHAHVVDGPDGFDARLDFNAHLIDEAAAAEIAADLAEILAKAAADPDAPVRELVRHAGSGPYAAESADDAFGAPSCEADSGLTAQVLAIWCDVLRVEEIALDDDLYDLGGHSLTITQIAGRIRKEIGIEVPFEVFADDPTVIGVVEAIGRAR
ncbi:condensation domain-containing protein [Actinospica robiniae]|uniref:condensation domain-containing protein n=1 Tax=Actinospica robiniae TaxID=304901 RepID=UPI0004111E12|nr:condensation domain-containing protein [Actinospica robiniae]